MRNVSRSKLFICFRPEVIDMDDHRYHPHRQPFEMDPKMRTRLEETNTNTSTTNSVTTSHNDVLTSPTPKKNLSRVMKAVFFETILTRRIRNRKSLERESDRSSRGASSSTSSSRRRRKSPRPPETTTCSYSPPSSSPPSRSVSAPELRILADQVSTPRKILVQNDEDDDNNNYKKNPKLYMLLLATLTVTVIWGKLCAILFTSIWMYFFPRRGEAGTGSSSGRNANMAPGRRAETTGEYSNKRVVMEGILGRNHHYRR